MADWFPRRVPRAALSAGTLFLLASCSHDGAPPPATLYTLAVDAAPDAPSTAPAGTVVRAALGVVVRDPSGARAAGVRVRFRATDGASHMRDSIVASGPDGVARGEAVLRGTAGAASFVVFVPGQESDGVAIAIAATAAPAVTQVVPSTFGAGDTVTLRGSGFAHIGRSPVAVFGALRGDVIEVFGDTAARVVAPACMAPGASYVRLAGADGETAAAPTTVQTRPTVALGVGQAAFAPAGSGCITLPGDGAQYLVVPQFAGVPTTPDHGAQSFLLSVGASGGATTAATPDASGTQPAAARFDAFLRARERETASLARLPALDPGVSLPALEVGRARTFSVINSLCAQQQGGCTLGFGTVSATLRFLGEHVAVYVDDAKLPGATLSDDELSRFGALFDRTLYQIDVQTFGSESDIDGNGHVIVLMTPSVNGLTGAAECAASGFVAGFFFSDDLAPRASHSNRGEVFYTLAPDPTGARSCAHGPDVVERLAPATFIHEFQHMISFNQHALVRGGDAEVAWLNEGLSHMAEEQGARYYEGLLPSMQPSSAGRAKSSPAQLFPDSASDFIGSNLRNAYGYLAAPSLSSLTDFADFGSLEERGAAWLFLRWLVDQKGDAILSRLEQTSSTGTRNVGDKAAEPFEVLFNDFALATYADSLPGVPRAQIPARYHFAPNRNLRTLFGRLATAYPIAPLSLPAAGTVQGRMLPGAFSFYSLTASASGAAQPLRLSPPTGASFFPGLAPQVGVLRVR